MAIPPALDWQHAIAANHAAWFARTAIASGGSSGTIDATAWAVGGAVREMNVFLAPEDDALKVDALVARARQEGARGVGFWVTGDAGVDRHMAPLLSRGCEVGWRPRWMWLEADRLVAPPRPRVEARIVFSPEFQLPVELPYSDELSASMIRSLQRGPLPAAQFLFAVDDEARVLGQVAVQPGESPSTVAGLYSCGVVPAARRQGIGLVLTVAAATLAFESGAEHVALNSTQLGAPLYASAGFVDLGEGQTWWLHGLR